MFIKLNLLAVIEANEFLFVNLIYRKNKILNKKKKKQKLLLNCYNLHVHEDLVCFCGTNTSKSLTVSTVSCLLLTYISVPTLIDVHTRFAGLVPGSCPQRQISLMLSPNLNICAHNLYYLVEVKTT